MQRILTNEFKTLKETGHIVQKLRFLKTLKSFKMHP